MAVTDAALRSTDLGDADRGGRVLTAIAKQLLGALATIFVISVITFFGSSIRSPEAMAREALGRSATQEQIAIWIRDHDLDGPLVERYGQWLGGVVKGDLGVSLADGAPVADNVVPRLGRTLILAAASLAIAIAIGVALAIATARRWGSRRDRLLNAIAVVLTAMPEFVTGFALLMCFAVFLEWLPIDSSLVLQFGGTFTEQVRAYVLPAATLVVVSAPFVFRTSRVSVREALVAPYTRSAVLRGLSRRRVIWGHAMPNAASPIIGAVTLNAIYLLSGVIVVESVFNFPGLGLALVEAVSTGDTPTVQAIGLLLGLMCIAVSTAGDLLAIVVNPRLKRRGRATTDRQTTSSRGDNG